ncbi:MAG: DUF1566 domain-containing protein [Bacteroidetes bacterium]|nr:DUF1566 domain-containing protein [Bacteroidota bacterium]
MKEKEKLRFKNRGMLFMLILLLSLCGFNIVNLYAQQPANYLAVLYDKNGNPLIDELVSIRIRIIENNTKGTIVFQEIQKQSTDSAGIVEFNLGHGTAEKGDYFGIDWNNGRYFIGIEYSSEKQQKYIPLCITQVLTNIINPKSELSTNEKDKSFSSTKKLQYEIGDPFNGGIIFYIDDSGEHGLIAAENDLNDRYKWGCNKQLGAFDLNDGAVNSTIIAKNCNNKNGAAAMCSDLILSGFDDWYLPSINELEKLYRSQAKIGNFSGGCYWSSTEDPKIKDRSWGINFIKDGKKIRDDKNTKFFVRPIRKF